MPRSRSFLSRVTPAVKVEEQTGKEGRAAFKKFLAKVRTDRIERRTCVSCPLEIYPIQVKNGRTRR